MPSALSINLHTLLEEDPVAYIVVFPDYQEDEVTLQEPLKILRLPIVLAMKASERLNTQDSTSWTSDNSGRNKVWNFSGSVFMIIGDADTPWHPQFFQRSHFRVPEFDRRETFMEYLAATTVPRIFTSCVSLFVVAHVHDHTPFPVPLRRHRTILVDDEAMFRQAFGNLACFSSAEKHMCIVLVMECLVAATGHLLRGHVGQLSSALNSGRVYDVWRCRQTLSSTVLQCRHSRVCV